MSYSSYREDFLRGVSLWSLNGNRMRDMPCHHEFHHHRRDFVWKHSLFHHMPLLVGCLNIRARERESFGMMTLADFVEWSWKKSQKIVLSMTWRKQVLKRRKKWAYHMPESNLKILFCHRSIKRWLSNQASPSPLVHDKSQTPTCWGLPR